jgi:hypothetical protein
MNKAVDRQIIEQVLPNFDCYIEESSVNPLGNGLINATFLVKSPQRSFVLQRINEHVFTQPEQVVNNAELINQHLVTKKATRRIFGFLQFGSYRLTTTNPIR